MTTSNQVQLHEVGLGIRFRIPDHENKGLFEVAGDGPSGLSTMVYPVNDDGADNTVPMMLSNRLYVIVDKGA